MWALGCLLYSFCYCCHPFAAATQLQIVNANVRYPPTAPDGQPVNAVALAIMQALLQQQVPAHGMSLLRQTSRHYFLAITRICSRYSARASSRSKLPWRMLLLWDRQRLCPPSHPLFPATIPAQAPALSPPIPPLVVLCRCLPRANLLPPRRHRGALSSLTLHPLSRILTCV